MGSRVEIKIAYIGAGSRAWAKNLMVDLALCPGIQGVLALYDIDHSAAVHNAGRGEEIFRHPEARTKFRTVPVKSLDETLKGADFVIVSIEPGGTRMRYADLEIPARYGIVQPVGDTTGPGGILRGLRAVPVFADFARDIMKHCPGAWVINYTNPMGLCTAALYAGAPRIKAFGSCHEVFLCLERNVSRVIERRFKAPGQTRKDIQPEYAGVNHFTFLTAARWRGHDLMPVLIEEMDAPGFWEDRTAVSMERKSAGLLTKTEGLLAYDFLRRFGALGLAGDRHLAEFVPWYASSEASLHRWGVLLTTYAWRIERASRMMRFDPGEGLRHSPEEGVEQMCALLGLENMDTNVNLPNSGQMPQLPPGAIVETCGSFRRDSLRACVASPLPEPLACLSRRVAEIQRLILEAALEEDYSKAFEALLLDPLVRVDTGKAAEMFGEMLDYASDWLPGAKKF